MDILPQASIPDANDLATVKAQQLKKRANTAVGVTEKQRQQAKKVSQDFEALFVGMMMKSMRDTVPQKKTLTGGGHGEEAYRSMLDQEYAAASVKRGGLGLAKQIEKDIIRQESVHLKPSINQHE